MQQLIFNDKNDIFIYNTNLYRSRLDEQRMVLYYKS